MIEKRIAINTIFLYIRMILVMGVTLFTSRIVLRELGVTDYGIYNVVGGVVAMVSFLNTSLSNGYQRYFNIALGKESDEELQRVFSASLYIQVSLIAVTLLLCETIGLWFVNHKMSIPIDRLTAANYVYQSSLFIFIMVLLRVPFHAVIIAYEKMNIFAYISVIEVIAQLGCAYTLSIFPIGSDRLIIYGIIMAFISFTVMTSYVFFARRCNRQLLAIPIGEKDTLKDMLSFSGWNIFGSVAHLIRGNGINILLNVFFNPAINAANGFASQVSGGITALAHNVLTASKPQVVKHYAKGNIQSMLGLTYSVSRYVFCLLWIMSFPIILKINYIFQLWLGNETPQYTQCFTILVLCTGVIEAFASPISTLAHATGRMKAFQISVSIVIMLVLPLAYLALKLGCPPQSVYYVSFFIGILAQVTRIYVIKRIIPEFSYRSYWRLVISRCLVVVISSLVFIGTSEFLFLFKIPQLIDLFVLITFTFILVLIVGLTKDERSFIIDKISHKICQR